MIFGWRNDVFSEESNDFRFDTSKEDSDRDTVTSSIALESEQYEEVSDFSYLTAWCVQDLHFSV
jgi:hypothetical protein